MLNEVKLKSIPMGQLIITDRTAEVCRYIKIACEFIKKNLFSKKYPEEYMISINNVKSYNHINTRFTTSSEKIYYFEYIVSNIDENGKEYNGEININDIGELVLYTMNEIEDADDIVCTDEYKVESVPVYESTNYSLDISNSATIDNNILKFNDENIKISVINDLKNKIAKPFIEENNNEIN